MPRLRVFLFGSPRIECNGTPVVPDTRKAVALLSYLAITARPHSRDSLTGFLWPEYGRSQSRSSLRRTLSVLNKALAGAGLLLSGNDVSLNADADLWFDVIEFRRLLSLCRTHDHGAEDICERCTGPLARASELYRDDFMAGFGIKDSAAFDDWQCYQAEGLRLELTGLLERLVKCYVARRDYEQALHVGRRWLATDSLHEAAHRALMEMYIWTDHRAEALRQYHQCAALLQSELDTVPEESTRSLYEMIRNDQMPAVPPAFPDVAAATGPAAPAGPAAADAARADAAGSETEARNGARSLVTDEELRIVTVVATGLKGASLLIRRPKGAAGEQEESTFADLVGRVVAMYGGRIESSGEGAVHAVFGASTVHESDPELAIRVALETHRAARPLRLSVSTGISTGAVYVSHGTCELHPGLPHIETVIREAQKLRRMAASGSILAGESTFRSTRAAFRFREHPVVARGPGTSARIFEVSGRVTVPGKASRLGSSRAEFVGRENEFDRLRSAFRAAVTGNGAVVCVTGDAGVGKSRLIEELRHEAIGVHDRRSASHESPYWLEGRCLSTAVTARYWPFLDVLKDLFAFEPGDDDAGRELRIRIVLNELISEGCVEQHEAAQWISVLCDLLSVPCENAQSGTLEHARPEQTKHLTFECIRSLIRALTRRKPVVLVLEDLHWADGLSLDLVKYLLESVTELSILMICVYRPYSTHRSRHISGIAAQKCAGHHTEIVLPELAPAHGAELADSLIPSGSALRGLKRDVLAKAQGNPFFLEELIRSLVDSGAVVRHGTRWRAGNASDPVPSIPESLQRVILSRVGRLEKEHVRALECAAVVGRLFERRVLAEAVQISDLDGVLDELQDRELIYEERAIPEQQFSFTHVLTQETIYESIPEWRREILHRSVATALTAAHGAAAEQYYEQVAFHFDRSRDRDKAIEYHFLAGKKARRAYANEEAVAHLLRGLNLLRSAPTSDARKRAELDFLITVGVPLTLREGHSSAAVADTYERARELCDQVGTSSELFEVLLGIRRLHFGRGAMNMALESSRQMLDISAELEDEQMTARAHMMMAEVFCEIGEFAPTVAHGKAGEKLCRPNRTRSDLVRFGNDSRVGCLEFAARGLWYLGFADQAQQVAENGLARARKTAHPFTLVFALFFTAFVCLLRREADRALVLVQELLRVASAKGFSTYLACGPALRAWALAEQGRTEEAIPVFERFLQDPQAPGTFHPHFLSALAACYGRIGRVDDGLACIGEALECLSRSHARGWEAELFRLRGELARLGGLPDDRAEADYGKALEVAQRQRARSLALRAAVSMSRLLIDHGRPQQARELLGDIYSGFSEGHATADLREAAALLSAAPVDYRR